jgi:hypothetical protein
MRMRSVVRDKRGKKAFIDMREPGPLNVLIGTIALQCDQLWLSVLSVLSVLSALSGPAVDGRNEPQVKYHFSERSRSQLLCARRGHGFLLLRERKMLRMFIDPFRPPHAHR